MEKYHKISTICLFILTSIAIAFVLSTTKFILIPFTLSIFISLIYSPTIHYFQRKTKLPKNLILVISLILFIATFFLITLFVGYSIDSFVQGADQYKEKIDQLVIKFVSVSQSLGFSINASDVNNLNKNLPLGKLIKDISGSMINILSNTFLVIIFTMFLLTGESMSEGNGNIFNEIKNNARKYVQTKLLTSLTTGIITYIILMIFNTEMAFMFAVLTFLLNFIPNIGSMIAVFLPIPIVILQYGFGIQFAVILTLLILTQVTIGNILEPKIMGESMGLHPVTILLFLTFWGYLWGIPGMFLSVPITATLKIILSKFEMTKPVANLFAGKFNLY